VVPHQLGMTTVLVVPDGSKEVVREDWELEGRDAAHVPDLIRASINLRKNLARKMDCRVKPGNDEWRGRSY
jgi:putative hydrolase of the HAD superfamily